MMDVYEPREDSFLLAEQVKRYSKGRVLDMGTGSVILASVASETADEVVACDIDDGAIALAKKNLKDKGVSVIKSDLFSGIEGLFDVIIFNPPYLPDPEDDRARHTALDGGKEGWELIGRFLSSAGRFLKSDGMILLLFSTFSDKDKVEELIAKNGFLFEQVSEMDLFSEILYVYKLRKKIHVD